MNNVFRALILLIIFISSFTAFAFGYGKELNISLKTIFILAYSVLLIRFFYLKTFPSFIFDAIKGMELFLGRKKSLAFFVLVSTIGAIAIIVEFISYVINS